MSLRKRSLVPFYERLSGFLGGVVFAQVLIQWLTVFLDKIWKAKQSAAGNKAKANERGFMKGHLNLIYATRIVGSF